MKWKLLAPFRGFSGLKLEKVTLMILALFMAGCQSPTTPSAPPPPPPPPTAAAGVESAVVSAAGGTYSVPVTWFPYQPQNATIRVWMGSSPGSFNLVALRPGWSSNAVVSGLKKNTRYYFRLTALSTNSLECAPSGTVSYSIKGGAIAAAPAPSTAQ